MHSFVRETAIVEELEYREGIRFPVARTEKGRSFSGVEKTLGKPHGYRSLMEQVIRELAKGPKRFETLTSKLAKKYSWPEVENALEILKIDGIIQVLCKNERPSKGHYWVPKLVFLDPRAEIEVKPPKTEDDLNTQISRLKEEVLLELGKAGPLEESMMGQRLLTWLAEERVTDLRGNVIAEPKAWIKYRSVVLALAHSVRLKFEGRREPLRVISERVWGKSKIIDRYKDAIVEASGVSALSKLNITVMPSTAYLYGDVTWKVNGHYISGTSGLPVVITEDTIKALEIAKIGAESILIVENFAVFIELLQQRYYGNPKTLVIWGEGYLSSSKRRLLGKILRHRKLPVYIWSDIDADGLLLTLDIINLVHGLGSNAKPILMSSKELALSLGGFNASDPRKLQGEKLNKVFSDLLPMIKEGQAMEQEELLLFFEHVKKELP